jgi:hypothetical protein
MTPDQLSLAKDRLLAIWKWSLSFRKRDWELSDYPVAFRHQEVVPTLATSRFKQHRYIAYIVNWHLTGGGDTPQGALDALRESFETVKRNRSVEGKPLKRPGTRVPLEFASQQRIVANHDLSEDFIRRILDLDWAWISDESSLWEFHSDETNEPLFAKIKQAYGVDVSDIEFARLSEILDRIAATRHKQIEP